MDQGWIQARGKVCEGSQEEWREGKLIGKCCKREESFFNNKKNLKECFPQVILRCFNLTVITNPHGRLGKLWESLRSCGCNHRLCSGFLSVFCVELHVKHSHINHRFPGSYLFSCFFVPFTNILYTACFLMISFLVHITECIQFFSSLEMYLMPLTSNPKQMSIRQLSVD